MGYRRSGNFLDSSIIIITLLLWIVSFCPTTFVRLLLWKNVQSKNLSYGKVVSNSSILLFFFFEENLYLTSDFKFLCAFVLMSMIGAFAHTKISSYSLIHKFILSFIALLNLLTKNSHYLIVIRNNNRYLCFGNYYCT